MQLGPVRGPERHLPVAEHPGALPAVTDAALAYNSVVSSPLLLEGVEIAEHLPGEPERGPLPAPRLAIAVLGRLVLVATLSVLATAALPLFAVGVLVKGRPPNVPATAQVARYLRYTWTVRPPRWSRPLLHRLWLTLEILRKLVSIPLWGLAWFIDEVLYGRRLDAAAVVEPLVKVSAARSGSTQMARYLEEDPHLVSPNVLQMVFPYLWLWRLAASTIGRVISPEAVNRKFIASLPPEFIERHEGDLFHTDTFEVSLYSCHLNGLSMHLGPEVLRDEFAMGEAAPWNRRQWEHDFVELFDRIARKTLVWNGAADGSRRVFIKGHFLAAADALERRFPDARFLTMVRHPSKRLRSAINYLRANPVAPALGPAPWSTVGPAIAQTEARYCEVEQAWFCRENGARRCVVRFTDFVEDLEGTMRKVYRECLDLDELPPHVPREHTPRRRTSYLLDRSLDRVGVDRTAFEARLAGYIEWSISPCSRS